MREGICRYSDRPRPCSELFCSECQIFLDKYYPTKTKGEASENKKVYEIQPLPQPLR